MCTVENTAYAGFRAVCSSSQFLEILEHILPKATEDDCTTFWISPCGYVGCFLFSTIVTHATIITDGSDFVI